MAALKLKAKKIIIFSRDEYKQSLLQSNLKSEQLKKFRFFIGDIRDLDRLRMAFEGCDYIIHTAAMKRIDSSELNPMEAIKTNIIGTQNVITAALEKNVNKVVALSTDKAAAPSSLYGATKLASDKLFVASNNLVGKKKTRFSVVRYGNVANSTGSILPIIKNLKKNEIFKLTHPEMTRYWISINEGVNFVLNTLHLMYGSEIFVPKLPSFKIIDLLRALKIENYKISGISAGEKLHETMISEHDAYRVIDFKSYYIISPGMKFLDEKINFQINKLKQKGKYIYTYNSSSNDKKSLISIKELIKKIESN
jgi:UDP-N-acetylglucosamine 4,6-dehydratase